MTDFVSRLLGRATAGAPPIRPVVASLFEPVRTRADVEPALPMGAVTESAPQWTPDAPIANRLPAAEDPHTTPPAKPETPARQPEIPTRQTAGHEVTPPTPPLTTEPDNVSTSPAPEHPDTPVAAAPAPSHPVSVEVFLQQSAPLPGKPASAAPKNKAKPGPRGRLPEAPDPHVPTPPVEATPEPARAHPVQPVHTVVRDRAPLPKPPRPASRRDPAPETTVHISIGRVEVKAAAEPAVPPRKEPSRRPALSLDDYLRDRTGGDRR